jgi:hypothetical protein
MAPVPVASLTVTAGVSLFAALESLVSGSAALGRTTARVPLGMAAVAASAPAAPAVALSAAVLVLTAGVAAGGYGIGLLASEETLQPSKEAA